MILHIQYHVYNNDKTPECITVSLERVRPAMSTHTHSLTHSAHTQAHEVTDTRTHTCMKINFFLHDCTAGQLGDLSFPHLCAIMNLLGEWNGEFSAPFKTKPGID